MRLLDSAQDPPSTGRRGQNLQSRFRLASSGTVAGPAMGQLRTSEIGIGTLSEVAR